MHDNEAKGALGDAGKGSFEQSQNEGAREEWRDKLRDELAGAGAPREERTDAAGPGRGRF